MPDDINVHCFFQVLEECLFLHGLCQLANHAGADKRTLILNAAQLVGQLRFRNAIPERP